MDSGASNMNTESKPAKPPVPEPEPVVEVEMTDEEKAEAAVKEKALEVGSAGNNAVYTRSMNMKQCVSRWLARTVRWNRLLTSEIACRRKQQGQQRTKPKILTRPSNTSLLHGKHMTRICRS